MGVAQIGPFFGSSIGTNLHFGIPATLTPLGYAESHSPQRGGCSDPTCHLISRALAGDSVGSRLPSRGQPVYETFAGFALAPVC